MTLHPQAQQFVDNLRKNPRPGWEEMGVEEARETFQLFEPFYGAAPEVARVQDLHTASNVPLRFYCDQEESCPVVLYFHGGGFVLGDIRSHDALCRRIAKQSGCAVVSVEYRPSPENRCPGPVDDCYEALCHVVEIAGELNIDPSRIAVAGDSAGGHLAASVSILAREESGPKISLQVLLYPLTEPNFETDSYNQFASGFGLTKANMQWFWDQFLGGNEPDWRAAPTMAESHADLPPAFVVVAEYDVLRDEGLAYAEQLRDAGVDVVVKRYAGMLHGFIHFAGVFETGIAATEEVSDVIRQALQG